MNVREITGQVARLGALPYFPSDDDARIAIAEVFAEAAVTIEQVKWTVKHCLKIWDKWEGPHELRAVLCSRFRPADGVEAFSRLPQFADGIPSEYKTTNLQLTGAAPARQLAGDVANPSFPNTAAGLIRSLTAAPRERDRVDEISEYIEREKAIKKAALPDESEIERIRKAQEVRRDPEAAEKLARELGIEFV